MIHVHVSYLSTIKKLMIIIINYDINMYYMYTRMHMWTNTQTHNDTDTQ